MSLSNFEIVIAMDLSLRKLCPAKRSSDQKIQSAFRVFASRGSWNAEMTGRFIRKRIRCRDKESGVEAEIRKKCLQKKLLQAAIETQSRKFIKKFEAKSSEMQN